MPSRFQLSERARRILRTFVALPLYFLCCLFSSAYETFPYDRVRDYAAHQVELNMPGAELEIVSLEPAWITGVEATGVRLRFPAEPGEERRAEVTIPRVYARAGILSYLFGSIDVNFEIETDGGGTITGEYVDDTSGTGADATGSQHVVAHIANVDLRRIGAIRHFAHLPVEGVVSGDIDVTLASEIDETSGLVTLTIADVALGDGRAQVPLPIPGLSGGFAVDRIAAGDVNLNVTIEHGVGRVQQLNADGDDLQLQGQGTVRLLRPFQQSALDVLVRINIAQSYRDRNPRVGTIFALAEGNPLVAPYRTADGAFQIRLQGAIAGRVIAMPAATATFDGH
jgi:type II secretion system protein N